MKVLMLPTLDKFEGEESGIKRVVEAYHRYLPEFGIELVGSDSSYDLKAVHAGMTGSDCDIAHLHGMYFTADYQATNWEKKANANIVQALRSALAVTVPSAWVAEIFQRDMRINPSVIPHGIDWEAWQHSEELGKYVIWNKNRVGDVCSPEAVGRLAPKFKDIGFVTTYAPRGATADNIITVGLQPNAQMKGLVQRALVYLSTTKETFGIGVLEALASGTPVLGWNFGGNCTLVEHGQTGYLAQPGNWEDLEAGMEYCLKYRKVLGDNARQSARKWTWQRACGILADVYMAASLQQPSSVAVVITVYNKPSDWLERAIQSVKDQTLQADEIIVVDDGSSGGVFYQKVCEKLGATYIRQDNKGVAEARNVGMALAKSKYICSLDADDAIAPDFLKVCVDALEADRSLGIAYTGLTWVKNDGSTGVSPWPGTFDYDRQLLKQNQIPTCCVFRKEMWTRLGGYRQRYAPYGAGEEDAEFWLRAGAYGFNAKKVTEEPLFVYSWGAGQVALNSDHVATDWTAWHPWVKDGQHPLASLATPKSFSHPVRQYDEPIISVIIPVGPGHEEAVINALDSLEAQTFRRWEVILVWDGDIAKVNHIYKAYPYAKIHMTKTAGSGAGFARNLGAKQARGSFLVFLDADDHLNPTALGSMLQYWDKYQAIVYTDYVDKAFWNREEYLKLNPEQQLFYNEKTGEAVIRRRAYDYDCTRAIAQPEFDSSDPNMPFYIWCLVTCLIPRAWHEEIGGFDNILTTWEDIEYHWRMARYGKCYVRIPEPLVAYRFYTGTRRQRGIPVDEGTKQDYLARLAYIEEKLERIPPMGCGTCPKPAGTPLTVAPGQIRQQALASQRGANTMSDGDFKLCRYNHGNRGVHPCIGMGNNPKIDYGYRAGGETFLVHINDINAQPELFIPIDSISGPALTSQQPVKIPAPPKATAEPVVSTPTPTPGDNAPVDEIPGIDEKTAAKLLAAGITTRGQVASLTTEQLVEAGLTKTRAMLIHKTVRP